MFKLGISGNPSGRPKGSLDKRTKLRKLLEPHAEDLVAKAVQMTLDGDAQALKLCIDRLIPKARHNHFDISIDEKQIPLNAKNLLQIGSTIVLSALQGDISPEQAKTLSDTLESQRKLIETTEVQQLITKLEERVKDFGR